MIKITQFFRLFRITQVLSRHRIDQVVFTIPWLVPFSFLIYINPWNWTWNRKEEKNKSRGERLRLALTELGPIFVKFGQMLATRGDILPNDIALELQQLLDQVSPFPSEQAEDMIVKELKKPIDELFLDFEPIPLASASIAQVHSACLKNGKSIVIKVRRPGIKKIIQRDVALLKTIANLLDRFLENAKQLRIPEVVAEFERHLGYELDLLHEAANASQLRRNFINKKELHVPEIYWDFCTKKVIVMEKIEGISISNLKELRALNVNLKKLATRGVEIFFTQVFCDSFFHADMHAGNIFVDANDPEDPSYIAVDFGIMGSLDRNDQRYLAENILAFFNRDYRRIAQLHVESGWVPAGTRTDEFEAAIRAVGEPIFERPLKDISGGKMLLNLFQTAQKFHMQVQPQLLLLQKTLLAVEGLGRQLDPDLDLWATAKPFIERWLKQQFGLYGTLKRIKEDIPYLSDKLPEIPSLIYAALQHNSRTVPAQQTASIVIPNRRQKKSLWLSSFAFLGAFISISLGNLMFSWVLLGAGSMGLVFSLF